VLKQYQRARQYAMKNTAETALVLATAAKVDIPVANVEVKERTKYPDPTPGAAYRDALAAVAVIVKDEHLAVPGADLDAALAAHATLGMLSDCLWRQVQPTRAEVERVTTFCLRAVTS
jgi:hypothetical protein